MMNLDSNKVLHYLDALIADYNHRLDDEDSIYTRGRRDGLIFARELITELISDN